MSPEEERAGWMDAVRAVSEIANAREAERDAAQDLVRRADTIIAQLLAGERPPQAELEAWIDESRDPILAAVDRLNRG